MATTSADIGTLIFQKPTAGGGSRACVKSGISVKALLARTKAGQSPDQILVSYPFLTRGEIYAALAYYEMNRDEIDGALIEDARLCDENARNAGA